jgi:hypothetical protein
MAADRRDQRNLWTSIALGVAAGAAIAGGVYLAMKKREEEEEEQRNQRPALHCNQPTNTSRYFL